MLTKKNNLKQNPAGRGREGKVKISGRGVLVTSSFLSGTIPIKHYLKLEHEILTNYISNLVKGLCH